jgi:nucleoside-diphosphate-sugar epimerase
MKSALILGSGYTGTRLAEYLKNEGVTVYETSRTRKMIFDLERDSTWANLPKADGTFWMFPPLPENGVRKFLAAKAPSLRRIVIVGSISSFENAAADDVVDERTPVNLSDPRVIGEQQILARDGIVVRSAGIYGPRRDPVEWLRAGRISDFKKFLNVIHVDDLVEILWAAMNSGRGGASYIAADGHPHRWSELADRWQQEFSFKIRTTKTSPIRDGTSKQVNGTATLKELGVSLKFPDVVTTVQK